ncbi:SPOR domain-containing protein [Helicobacter sp. 11S03491-1]|uniref:SPOR domain-containing protein n=1 Tax=Helicobacter sp. 11S03491-1 TaxID=1476196 RepID=UPI000BA7AB51|nr:SPOR domain-containing protein [Helicobacter sp. 11S03491-1]PAF41592.1 hypothetical protein BKH45_06745 [Helicobacter sp. 11S03491-1]
MEEKKELNEILLGDHNNNQPSKTKKLILMIIVAIIIVFILLVVVWKMTREEPKEQVSTIDNSIQKMDTFHDENENSVQTNDNFENMSIDDMSKTEEDNKFDKIVQDIKSKQLGSTQESAQESSKIEKPVLGDSHNHQALQSETIQEPALSPDKNITKSNKSQKTLTAKTSPKKEDKKPQKQSSSAAKPKQASAKIQASKNGSIATAGHYLQIGAFSKTPNKYFLEKIKKYSYRIQTSTNNNGQTITKYLIGPYKSRTDANRDVLQITTDIGKPIHIEIK